MPSDDVTIEVNGHEADEAAVSLLEHEGWGHFTAMQVRGGRTRGLGLHLARLEAAHREVYGRALGGEEVRAHATGQAGDIYLCHPFIVHTATWPHRGTAPRTIAQPAVHARDGFAIDGSDSSPWPGRSSRAWRCPIEAPARRGQVAGGERPGWIGDDPAHGGAPRDARARRLPGHRVSHRGAGWRGWSAVWCAS